MIARLPALDYRVGNPRDLPPQDLQLLLGLDVRLFGFQELCFPGHPCVSMLFPVPTGQLSQGVAGRGTGSRIVLVEVVSKTACMYVVIKCCGMDVSAKIESVMDIMEGRLTGKQTEHLVRVTSEEVGTGHSERGRFGMSVGSGLE
jgi:hypothetical protein